MATACNCAHTYTCVSPRCHFKQGARTNTTPLLIPILCSLTKIQQGAFGALGNSHTRQYGYSENIHACTSTQEVYEPPKVSKERPTADVEPSTWPVITLLEIQLQSHLYGHPHIWTIEGTPCLPDMVTPG